MVDASFSISAAAHPAAAAAPAAHAAQPGFFDHLLSELNPLQYLPVVGTIYRAVTGDTIPEPARFAGSLVVSGLTGGPVGLAINVGSTLLEHMLGIDPEKLGDQVLASLGIGSGAASPAAAPSVAVAAASPDAASPAPNPVSSSPASPNPASTLMAGPDAVSGTGGGWSVAQLAAYGISRSSLGTLTRGGESGADVLNTLEMARLTPSLDSANGPATV